MHGTVVILALTASVFLAACGAAPAAGPAAASSSDEQLQWTPAQLAKLDAALRARIAREAEDRIAIKVIFRELPSDDVLADLMLNRVGMLAIGNVGPDAIHRLAARADVDRIEELSDVGYETYD